MRLGDGDFGYETAITSDVNGHILTNLNVFSPDSNWIVYDERSDLEGAKFDSASITRDNVKSGAIGTIYQARNGAFVGGVTYNPKKNSVVFIHGPENPTPDWSCAGHHRAGMRVDLAKPSQAKPSQASVSTSMRATLPHHLRPARCVAVVMFTSMRRMANG